MCPFLFHRDTLDGIERLEGVAHDVIHYEDVDCQTFLRESPWHVLCYVGEQCYAYHRAELERHFDLHHWYHPVMGMMVETPHKHTITHPAKMMFKWCDYSIVKLIPAYQDHSGHHMYGCQFYTVYHWVNKNNPDKIYLPT